MTPGFVQRMLSRGTWFAPLLVGLAYGLAQSAFPSGRLDFFYWQSPFFFAVLAGVAIAFGCRPVLSRIGWTRPAAAGVGIALLAGIGPLGDWAAAALVVQAGLGAFPLHLPASGWPLLTSALAAGGVMALLFRPGGGELGAAELWERLGFEPLALRLARLAALGLFAVTLSLAVAWWDARQEETATALYVPLVAANPWLRLEGLWLNEGAGAAALLLAIRWLRALALLAPLVPIALVVRGSFLQLTLVFMLLLFVLGEFAPLMMDQPYPSLQWLFARTGLGLARALVLGAAVTLAVGVVRRRPAA